MINVFDSGRIRTVRLARAEKANALTSAMLNMIADAAETAARIPDLRGFVLTGDGKVFSAGADLEEIAQGLATDPAWGRASTALADLPFLSVAALNGTLAGGAFGLALTCDLRVAVSGAKFFYPVMKLGQLPQAPDAPRLSALIGPARAKLLLLAGQRIDTAEALSWGLIDRIAEPDTLDTVTMDLFAASLEAREGHTQKLKKFCF